MIVFRVAGFRKEIKGMNAEARVATAGREKLRPAMSPDALARSGRELTEATTL